MLSIECRTEVTKKNALARDMRPAILSMPRVCIHFWEVEYQLPERVFRQFRLLHPFPLLTPPAFIYFENIRKWTRGRGLFDDGSSVDWSEHFHQFIVAPPQNFAQRSEHGQLYPYLPDRYHEYIEWFFHHGMLSVYPKQDNEEILSQAVPEHGGHVGGIGYVPDAMIQARLRFRQLKQTAKGISMVKTPGQKAFRLMMLENRRDVLSDLGQIALFTAMLEQAELPADIRNIDISTDFPDQFPRKPRVEVPQTSMYDDISDIFQSMRSIRIERQTLGESGALRDGGAGPSMENLARRKKKIAQQI